MKYRRPFVVGTIQPYPEDTGCDIIMPKGSPVIAIDSGLIVYAEGWPGCGKPHTPWIKNLRYPHDTPGAILLLLDHPVIDRIGRCIYAWYCHLELGFKCLPDGNSLGVRVKRGDMIGHSGLGRGIPHLHFGLLTERSQDAGTYMPPLALAQWLKTETVLPGG